LSVLIGICTVFFTDAIVFLPIAAYEIYLDRLYPAGLVLVAGFLRFCTGDGFEGNLLKTSLVSLCVYLTAETLLAVYLAYSTQRLSKYETENRKIRDESEIKKETLRKQNRNLMEEQDKSITAAQLSERNRIAREIHDNVGHMLSRSILQVGAMMVVHKDEPVGEELKVLRQTLDTAMNNIRESVHDIRDEAISLSSALEEIVEPLKDSFKVSYEFDADEAEIPKDVKYAGINIVKEAVSNIIKYSRNECVDVRFIEHPSMYQIIVHDYKQSKDVSQRTVPVTDTSGEGMGLENIKTRAEKLGGNATFTNDNGFRVFVRIPKQNV
jgi:signal transduction histidine kinase